MPIDQPIDPLSAPAWSVRVQAHSFDELSALIDRGDGVDARTARSRRGFFFDHYRVAGVSTKVGVWTVNQPMTVRGQLQAPCLHLGPPPGSIYRFGRRAIEVGSASSLVMLPAGWEFSRTSPNGRAAAAMIDPVALVRELEPRRLGRGRQQALMPLAMALSDADRDGWALALEDVVTATRPGTDPGLVARTEAVLVARLTDCLLRHEVVRHADGVDLRRLAAVENWIEGHLAEPITLGRLCAVAGVGARALQKAFELRRGRSPLRFVTERRLLAAFHRLSRPAPEETVTAVCLSLGFNHPARFSGLYRAAFGELPSRTLARCQR